MNMNKKKIAWVTPDCFVDCDIDIIPMISRQGFDIHWIVLFDKIGNRYKESDFDRLRSENDNLTVEFLYSKHRKRYPQNIFYYLKINRIIKRVNPDCIYSNLVADSPWMIPFVYKLPQNKWINTAHQGAVHAGFKFQSINKFIRTIIYNRALYINMFSKSQASLMKANFPKAKIFQFVLGLKYFGKPSASRPNSNVIKFLSFGMINYGKNVELLVDAACNLYEKGYRDFKVVIKGNCVDKDAFMKHVKYPEVIDADLRFIDNSEIPDMFTGSHFFVQPYRIVTQSGPFKIAMNYNVPLITSNLPGFTDEMKEGVTGFIFKTEDVESLENVMIKAIEIAKDADKYSNLCRNMKEYVDNTYSTEALGKQYIDMFNDVIKSSQL